MFIFKPLTELISDSNKVVGYKNHMLAKTVGKCSFLKKMIPQEDKVLNM